MGEANFIKVKKFLSEKWKNKKCNFCGSGEWMIQNKSFELREFHDGNLVLGGNSAVYPIMLVACKNCGYTVMVSSLIADLLEDKKGEGEGEEKEENKNA